MAAVPAPPTVTILGRRPDEELPQRRAKPAVEEPSLMYTRTIVMVIIMLMVLPALLIEVHRRSLSER